MPFTPYCIDIYQGDDVSDTPTALAGIDRAKASFNGIAFCWHKASQDVGKRDSRYAARRVKWMSGGQVAVTDVDESKLTLDPKWGAYHYLIGSNPTAEARNFLAAATLEPGDGACADWERFSASGACASIAQCDAFCNVVEDALGRPCWIYGGDVPREAKWADAPADMVARFSKRLLWFCDYNATTTGLIPLPWATGGGLCPLWQDDGDKYGSGPTTIPGINNYCDNSTLMAGMTVTRLAEMWPGATPVPAVA